MEEVKKIKKRKFNFLKFIVFILFFYIIISAFYSLYKVQIKNIVILNNIYLTDEEIIETAKLENYPSFIKTTESLICKRIEKLDLVEKCDVKKKLGFVVEITVGEYKVLYKVRSTNKYILSNGESLTLNKNVDGVPLLINYVTENVSKRLNEKFSGINLDILQKISEIEYSPTNYDEERFILYMNDGNMVYITLSKTSKLNKYDEIKKELEGRGGILYLDSGNYFEIKE